jgi:prophage regulatory protein
MKTDSNTNIIRLPQTVQKTGLSRSTIYSLIARGEFPQKIQLSTRSIGFLESEVNDWIESKLSQRA